MATFCWLLAACGDDDDPPPPHADGGAGPGGSFGRGGGAGRSGAGGSGAMAGSGGVDAGNPDRCPGQLVNLTTDAPVLVGGPLDGLANDFSPYCARDTRPAADAVYAVLAQSDGTIELKLLVRGGEGVLYVRSQCESPERPLACEVGTASTGGASGTGAIGDANMDAPGSSVDGRADSTGAGGTEAVDEGGIADQGGTVGEGGTLEEGGGVDGAAIDAPEDLDATLSALEDAQDDVDLAEAATDAGSSGTTTIASTRLAAGAGQLQFVIVDGLGSEYELELALHPSRCGDRVVSPPEECDFGDTAPNDGCSPECKFEAPNETDRCGGRTRELIAGTPTVFPGHTVGFKDDYPGPSAPLLCNAMSGGRDAVFAFSTATPGKLKATVEADFDVVLALYARCDRSVLIGALACKDSTLASADEVIETHVEPGLYFFLVDGYSERAMGRFELRLDLTPD
jgi:cysteine-rich repeat protein